jgi:transposase
MAAFREEDYLQMLKERDEKIALLEQENAVLRQKIDLLVRRVFGSSSEKLDPKQLELLLSGQGESGKECASSEKEEAFDKLVAPIPRAPSKSRRERAQGIPENLCTVEETIEPEAVKAAPQEWRRIGEEISEQLDYEPARFFRRRLIRPKYVNRKEVDLAPIAAPLPPSLQERCTAAPGLLAQIVVAKYCDHLPLYRQEYIYSSRHGIWIPRQTMARWVDLVAFWLTPIYRHICAEVTGGGYVQVDETPVRYLEPGNGKTKIGYLWVCNRPKVGVAFYWETSRAAQCIDNIIPVDFAGVLQCDAYAAYGSFAKRRPVKLAGCLAHVRRKFFEAKDQAPKIAGWVLRQIQLLYEIEDGLRKERAGPKKRQAVRASQSAMIHRRLHRCLIRLKTGRRYLPRSLMGKAIGYALDNWQALEVYLEDGRVEIDNNLVENSIRPTAVGKRNWLFFGDAEAGQRSAVIYTIIENCRRLDLDPYGYLCYVLTELPNLTNRQIAEVTPAAYAEALKKPLLRAAS